MDLVYWRGRDRRALPLRDRRAVLEDEITGGEFVFPSLRRDGDGFDAWTEVKRRGWEGMVAKDDAFRCVGGRSRSWVKVRREGRFVVVGLDIADGHASSLLLAARRGRDLAYVGRCAWGMTRGSVEQIVARCTRRVVPACRDAERTRTTIRIEPRVVVEVSYSELMVGWLRDPVLRGVVVR